MGEHVYVGSCMCGAVQFEFVGPVEDTYHCHCSVCRRLHSAGYVTWTVLPHRRFRLLSPRENLAFYESSHREHRAFCRTCGSHVFAEVIDPERREDVYVSLATLREPRDLAPRYHIYADNRASWVALDSRIPSYGGAGGDEPAPEGPRVAGRAGKQGADSCCA